MAWLDRARKLADQTPAHRNRYVDYLRALSIGAVVYGHWLMAVFTMQDGRVVTRNLLAEAPAMQILTWFFQVMPVFFMVGGYSNAASWSAAMQKGTSYADWLRARCQRLLGPTAVFALVWVPLSLGARFAIRDPDVLNMAGQLSAVPLWFMAVYLVVIPAAPAMFALHRRFGAAVPIVLIAAAAVLDALTPFQVKGAPIQPNWGWLNYPIVWLAIHQLGFLWQDGKLDRPPALRWILLAGGLAGLIALTSLPRYPFSLIGVPGEPSNTMPPRIVLVCLALFQLGLILATTSWVNRRLARRDPWARTILANSMIMTLYLWHITAMVVAVGAAYGLGYRFSMELYSGPWWVSRIGWLALLTVVLAGFALLFGRFERPRPGKPIGHGPARTALTTIAALAAAVGVAMLAIEGLCVPGEFWGPPATALLLLLAGAAGTGVRPSLYSARTSPASHREAGNASGH